MMNFSVFWRTCNYVKFSSCVPLWPQVPARNPNRHVPGSASTVNGGAAKTKPGAQRPSVVRTTLTGAAEPYNRRGDSRHDCTHRLASLNGELRITPTFA